MADFGPPVLTPADFATLQNTLGPMGVLTQMEAERATQAEQLAQRSREAQTAAGQAGQAYQEAAAAPSPNVAPNEELINSLTGGLSQILGNQGAAQRANQRTRDTRSALMQARSDNLTALRDSWSQKAQFADKAGDLEEKLKAQGKMEQLDKTLTQLNMDRGRADSLAEAEKDRQNRITLETLRQKDEGAKQAKQDQKTMNQSLNVLTDNMRQDPDIKNFVDVRDGYERVLAGAKRGDSVGDLALLYGYVKILDPGSVVREGEYANAENTAGVPENIRRMYNKAIDGSKLTPKQRVQFTQTSRQLYTAKQKNKDRAQGYWKRQAKAMGVDPELIMRDLNAPSDTATGAVDTTSAPAGPKAVRWGYDASGKLVKLGGQ